MNQVVDPGDHVIDATAGDGHDTMYLAKLVGIKGHVDSFTSQPTTITVTRDALTAAHLNKQVTLWQTGYDQIDNTIATDQPIKCAIFNLSNQLDDDKQLMSKPATTVTAIQASQARLTTNGLIIILLDTDHHNTSSADQAVKDYVADLDQHQYQVLQYQFVNQAHVAPYLLAIQKR